MDVGTTGTADYYEPVILSATDYFPFGMDMPGRTFEAGDYRFGFNGKEKDQNEEWGELTHYDYGFRIYNPGIGRFLSVDPLTRSYPWYTPYQFAGNTPIWASDLDGLEPHFSTKSEAQRVASDINAIFYSKYGDEPSKTALRVESNITRIKNPEYGFWDRIGFGSDPEFINKEIILLKENPNFS